MIAVRLLAVILVGDVDDYSRTIGEDVARCEGVLTAYAGRS